MTKWVLALLFTANTALAQWASVGTLGSANDKTAGTTIAITTGAVAEVGNVIIIEAACDNTSTSDGSTNEILSVADGSSNTYTKAREYCNAGAGSGGTGVVVALFYARVTTELGSGGTITVTFANSITATAASAWEFTISGNTLTLVDGVDGDYNGGTDYGSLDLTTSSEELLWVRGDGWEGDFSAATYTKTAAYAAALTGNGTTAGSAASNISVHGEHDIVTATTNASDPSLVTTSDKASVLVVLRQTTVAAGRNRIRIVE